MAMALNPGDDSCRVDACGNDGGDCAYGNQCIDDGRCSRIYSFWSYFNDNAVTVNHTWFCGYLWQVLIDTLELNAPKDCMYYMNDTDYNGDGALNFRELVPFGYLWSTQWNDNDKRGPGLNCSECTGMATYNA